MNHLIQKVHHRVSVSIVALLQGERFSPRVIHTSPKSIQEYPPRVGERAVIERRNHARPRVGPAGDSR